MATNKKTLVTVGIVGGIAILLGIVYAIYKSMNKISAVSNKPAQSSAKSVASAKSQLSENPSNVVLQAAYSAAANEFAKYLTSKTANKDGSTPNKVTSKSGNDAVTVDKDGSYIETGDPSTLYYSDGSVKANIDSNSGMFVDGGGVVVASSDGSPCHVDEYGNYTEADGSTYSPDGTPIRIDLENKTYTEEGSTDIFNMDGTPYVAPSSNAIGAIKQATIHKLFN